MVERTRFQPVVRLPHQVKQAGVAAPGHDRLVQPPVQLAELDRVVLALHVRGDPPQPGEIGRAQVALCLGGGGTLQDGQGDHGLLP